MLLNNIAWLLRHLPVFAIGGRGDYRLRPVHVDDLAALCVDLGARTDTTVVDAVGPESANLSHHAPDPYEFAPVITVRTPTETPGVFRLVKMRMVRNGMMACG